MMRIILRAAFGISCLLGATPSSLVNPRSPKNSLLQAYQRPTEKPPGLAPATAPATQPATDDASKVIRVVAAEVDRAVARELVASDPIKMREAVGKRKKDVSLITAGLSGLRLHFAGAAVHAYPAGDVDPTAEHDAIALELAPVVLPSANDPRSRVETVTFLVLTAAEATAAEHVIVKRFDAIVARVQVHVTPIANKVSTPMLARCRTDHVMVIARSLAAATNARQIPTQPQSAIVVLDATGSMLSRLDSAEASTVSIAKTFGPSRLLNIVSTRNDKTLWALPRLDRMTPSGTKTVGDFLKTFSAAGAGGVSHALIEAVAQNPDEIWLFSDGEYTRPEMDAVERLASEAAIPIHTILRLDDGKPVPEAVRHLRKISELSGGRTYEFPPK